MIVWGGFGGPFRGFLNTGGRYSADTDSWIATTTTSAPSSRYQHTAVWTGSEMIIWGGFPGAGGGRYDPDTDSWTATTTTNAPSARNNHTAVWTGSKMIVWGGETSGKMIVWAEETQIPIEPHLSNQNPSGLALAARTPPIVTNTGGRYCAAPPSPTPTPTPTATATATPTLTPRPSPTPRFAPTPRIRPSPPPRP